MARLLLHFQSRDVFSRLTGKHAVHQQKWIAVWQVFEYFMDIHVVIPGVFSWA